MAKKIYSAQERAQIRKTTRVEAFVVGLITAVVAVAICAVLFLMILNPAAENKYIVKFITSLVGNIAYAFIIYPIGWTFGAISVICLSMVVAGRKINKKMIKEVKILSTNEREIAETTELANKNMAKHEGRGLTVVGTILLVIVVAVLLTAAFFMLKSYIM